MGLDTGKRIVLGAIADDFTGATDQAPLEGRETPLSMALKLGNFGGVDFFTRAFEVLA